MGEDQGGLHRLMEVESDRGWNRFWVRDKSFFRGQGARGRIEPKDGSRFAVLGNWFHAAKVANADKAFGKHMQEETAQELIEG